MYIRRFHEKALGCCDPAGKEILVNVCLQDMLEENKLFLENLAFPLFSKLMEAARYNNEPVGRLQGPVQVLGPTTLPQSVRH